MLNVPFYFWCTFTVLIALLLVVWISPLLWDAAGYLNEVTDCVADLAKCQ